MILFADAQADLGLCCSHMPEDTFSPGASELFLLKEHLSYQIPCDVQFLHLSDSDRKVGPLSVMFLSYSEWFHFLLHLDHQTLE